jgi:hypothetical protein
MSLRQYYYNGQLKKFIIGFANIFKGLQVQTGFDACNEQSFIEVPICYGSRDRVVASIGARNTQNQQHTLPIMSCYMTGLELAPDRFHGNGQMDTRTALEQGGVFPDDVKVIQRLVPVPYNMSMELSLYSSNTDQMYQMLEQLLLLFEYDMKLQFNDAPFDWTRVTKVLLTGINNEENYPLGPDRRAIVWSMTFELPIWLSLPADVRTGIIQSIVIQIGDGSNLTLDEVDANGNLAPFGTGELYASYTISENSIVPDPNVPPPDPGNGV